MGIIKTLGYKRITVFVVLALTITMVEYLYVVSKQYAGAYQQKISLNILCEEIGGVWLRDFKECENASRQWCLGQGGEFNECESACRHKNSEICTMQCVPVCTFDLDGKKGDSVLGNIMNNKSEEKFFYKDLIVLDSPLPSDKIKSPLVVKGRARGNWFFEGSFPVILANWDGLIIAEGIAQAEGDWMTEDFVDFSATLNFTGPQLYDRASLILKKDNPSGLSENDDAFEVSLTFAEAERKSGE